MNHIYRSIWSESLKTWIAVSENTASKGKRSTVKKAVLATGLALFSSAGFALPTGGQVVAGQVNIDTPSATQMNIQQGSQNAIINWNGFSIAPAETVNIQQPNVSAVLLNRVVGVDASIIQGHLNANGQVFLINPNGVLFSNTAQVDVGGLVAGTHNISNADFLNGNYHFSQDGATGAVSNQGRISVPAGGTVALIGAQVSNSGTITTPQGSTVLAAGKTVDLDFKGNGLVEVNVPEEALNAQVTNKGAILADGGLVVLTAKAAGDLLSTVLGTEGLIQARSLTERNGEIILDGGRQGVVQVSGTLDVSGEKAGGKISVTGKDVNLNSSATLNAQALSSGMAGTINVLGDMANGTVNVAGTLDASASGTANGGFIETSAAHVKVADTAKVSTLAASGNSGTWLIDPYDFTIGTGVTDDITGASLAALLGSNNVEISTTTGTDSSTNLYSTTTGFGDIYVNDAVSWSANTTLTLNAQRNININANISSSGATGKLSLLYGQASSSGGAEDNYFIGSGVTINLAAGQNFSTQKGSDVANLKDYTVITDLGVAGDATSGTAETLQGMARSANFSSNYVLGADIDASATSSWNSGEGFTPIGNSDSGLPFAGIFDGLGHTITDLSITRPTSDDVGLFGLTSEAVIQNVGLTTVDITGQGRVGGLVGYSYGSKINNSYATGTVQGTDNVGGLVGKLDKSNISNAYAMGNVTGTGSYVGGLVGYGYSSSISNSYAGSDVIANASDPRSGGSYVGGLVGYLYKNSSISNSYATGYVEGNDSVGGLVGETKDNSNIDNASAEGDVKGNYSYVGGLVGYVDGGDISNSYATGNVDGDEDIGGLLGNGNVGNISNSYATGNVTGTGDSVGGLVGSADEIDISNSFATGAVTGSNYVGGLVGYSYGSIFGSSATGAVTGNDNVGGLVGYSYGSINNSYATGNVTGNENVGGLVGYAYGGNISDSYATMGQVTGGGDYVGGLVGYGYLSSINNSYATGDVTTTGSYVGGLVGILYEEDSSISNSYATGAVTGSNYVGGLAGYGYYSSINNSYATGNVTGTGDYVGGLVGDNYYSSISNSYATGNVTATGTGTGKYVGGLVGENYQDSISNSYATGNVEGNEKVGGLVGINKIAGSISNSFASGTVLSCSSDCGSLVGLNTATITASSAKTPAEMMQLATFSGWNISNTGGSTAIWRIYEGRTAPLLRSWLTPLAINSDGSYLTSGVDTSHLFGSGAAIYSDQQGYDIFIPVPAINNPTADTPDLDDQIVVSQKSTDHPPVITQPDNGNEANDNSESIIEIENQGFKHPKGVKDSAPKFFSRIKKP